MGLSIDDINNRGEEDFVSLLAAIFEHSPWVAELVYDQRPFADRNALHRAMVDAMRQAPELQPEPCRVQ